MNEIELKRTGLDNVYAMELKGSRRLCTKNLIHGAVYGEKLITAGKDEYRIWDPFRSKLAAMMLKGSALLIQEDTAVLYLGAANGTTVSHVSDIVSRGTVFAVEFSPRAMQSLIRVSIPRVNLIPILADAMHPNSYRNMVPEVDLIYQDVAQREQARIAIRNAELFLKEKGVLILMIKSRSIDSAGNVREVINNEVKKLGGFLNITEMVDLKPFHSDHVAVAGRKG